MKVNGLNQQIFNKQQRLQTQPADTYHEHEVRKALKDAGLSNDKIGSVLTNLHDRKEN